MKRTSTIVSLLVLVLLGCEQTLDVDLPYDKKLVLNGFILVDSTRVNDTRMIVPIMVTKTMPTLFSGPLEDFAVNGAKLAIIVDGQEYPCRFSSNRFFTTPDESQTWFTRTAKVVAQGEGMYAEAYTRIPSEPKIISVDHVDSTMPWGSTYTLLRFRTVLEGGTVAWVELSNEVRGLDVVFPMGMPNDYVISNAHESTMDTVDLWMSLWQLDRNTTITYRVSVADPAYARYLRSPMGDDSDPFGFGGSNPHFNVSGDGIGLMIGVAARRGTYTVQ